MRRMTKLRRWWRKVFHCGRSYREANLPRAEVKRIERGAQKAAAISNREFRSNR